MAPGSDSPLQPDHSNEERLRDALMEIVRHAQDDDWAERNVMCEHPFHRAQHVVPMSCPNCCSAWWDTRGLPPDADTAPRYALAAVACRALKSTEDR